MFGTNPVRKPSSGSGEILDVIEIFPTIQGEGPYAGRPAHFIRLAGCNLRCTFCDTDFETGLEPMSVKRILEALTPTLKARLVVITGGEPLLQQLGPLCRALLAGGYVIQIETAGTTFPDSLEPLLGELGLTFVCSPKTATVHPLIAKHCHHWKYIVRESPFEYAGDGLPMLSTQIDAKLSRLYRPDTEFGDHEIYVQPCEEYIARKPDPIRTKANVERAAKIAMKHGYTLSLQLHKIAGLP